VKPACFVISENVKMVMFGAIATDVTIFETNAKTETGFLCLNL